MKKNKYSFIVIIIITILVLYLSLKDNYNEIITELCNLNLIWLLVGVCLVFSYWFLRSICLYTLASKFNSKYKFKSAFLLALKTQFFNAITPFATGGQPFQIYELKKDKLTISQATNVIIQNFIVYQLALVLLGIFAIISNAFMHTFDNIKILKSLVILGFTINTLVIVCLFIFAFNKKINNFLINKFIILMNKLGFIKNKEEKLKNWNEKVNTFHDGAKILIYDKKSFIVNIILNIFALTALYLIPMTILYSTGNYHSFDSFTSIITCAYVMLIGSFVPIPGGSGGLEYSFTKFFGVFVSGSLIKTIMLIWRFLTYYMGMIIGAIAINIKKKVD